MPRKIHLTDLALRALPFSDTQVTYWDDTFPAFGVRIGKRSKTFIVVRDGGRRLKIGEFPAKSLKDARHEARLKLLQPAPPDPVTANVMAAHALSVFLESRKSKTKPRTHREIELILNKHLLPAIGNHLLRDIKTEDITDVTDSLLQNGTPSAANHLHSAAKTFFNWAVTRKYIKHSPLTGLAKPAKVGERERVLTDDELVAIYRAAVEVGYPFGFIVLICIHTAMRRNEVASLKWTYITPEFITLPAEITKNGHSLMLPNLIGENLALIPKTSEYLFPSAAGTPYSSWSKSKAKFDELCGVYDWTLHDLRRTFATNMARWELASPETVDRLLNHVTGAQTKIAKLYNRWHYAPQMRAALEAHEAKLAALISAR